MKTTALWLCLLMTPWIPQGQPYTEDDGRRGSSRSLAPLDDEESDFSGDASYVYVDSHRDNPMYYPKEGENVYRPGFLPKESDLDKIQYNDPLEEIDEIKPAMLLAQGDENGTYTQEDILDEVRRKLALDDAPTDQYIYDPYDSYDPYDYYGEEPEETTTVTQVLPPTMKPTESPMTTTTPTHTTSTSTTTSNPTTTRTPVIMSTTKPMSPSHKVPAILPEERVKTTTMSRPVAPATESMDDTQTEPIFDSDDATKALPFVPLATTEEEPLLITKPKVPPGATTAKLIISTKTTVKPTPELEPAVPTYEEPLSPSRRPPSSTAKFSTTTRPTSTTSTTTVKTLTSGTGSKSTTTTASSTTTTTTTALNRVVKNTVTASERSPHEPSLVVTTKAAILQEANTAVEGTGGPGVVPQNSQFSMIVLVICVISFVIVLLAVLVIIFLVRARLRRRGKYDISSEVESEATNGSAQNGKAVKFQEETDKKAVVTVQYNNSAA